MAIGNKVACEKYRKTDKWRNAYRDRHYQRKYGITPEQFEEKIKAQNGLCPIGLHPLGPIGKKGKNSPCMDHDHETGTTRLVVCKTHNLALGLFGDSTAELQAAIAYLNSYKKVN